MSFLHSSRKMALYSKMQKLELSESDLRFYCFPRPHHLTGRAQLFTVEKSFNKPIRGKFRRSCKRCGTEYGIRTDGWPTRVEECRHHWGKYSETKCGYYCCMQPRGSRPCSVARQHVTEEIDLDNLTGYINTSLNYSYRYNSKTIFAMDCEMVYTTGGMDVAALSIVDSDYRLVYETYVLPDSPIIDYNTNYSNLTEQQFRGVTTRLKDVHQKLLSLVTKDTILVGHGLDHDLLRLKVIHDHVVDTSVLYPHPRGLPVRNSLKFLKEKHLTNYSSGVRACNSASDRPLKCRADAEDAMMLACLKCQMRQADQESSLFSTEIELFTTYPIFED